jgi:subtilisin family serine protease
VKTWILSFILLNSKLVLASSPQCHADYPIINSKVPGQFRVMEIDTGISQHHLLKPYVKYDSSYNYQDSIGHGTHVAGIIVYGNQSTISYDRGTPRKTMNVDSPVCKQVKIFSCNYFDGLGNSNNLNKIVNCVKRAIKDEIDVINFSGGGIDFSIEEYTALKNFLSTGGILVTAIGNERQTLEDHPYYPAGYSSNIPGPLTYEIDTVHPNSEPEITRQLVTVPRLSGIFFVEATDLSGVPLPSSNKSINAIKEVGDDIISTLPNESMGSLTGSSMAAPAFLHKMLKYNCDLTYLRDVYGIERNR